MNEITTRDLSRGRNLKIGAVAAPVVLTAVPAIITFILLMLASSGPPASALILFGGMIASLIAFVMGIGVAAFAAHKHSVWSRDMRERIAAGGIRAEEIGWFKKELKPNEKRALKAVAASDLLLADAYRETLASRLTASRIIKSSKRELMMAKRRQTQLKQLKSARSAEFQTQVTNDIEKIADINDEAKLMLSEAESRLQMIEAAASRHGHLADSELALKKLSARTQELPLALESAKLANEIRIELENEEHDDYPIKKT